MDEKQKEELIRSLDKVSIIVLGFMFLVFPVIFSDLTTDIFVLPKQALIIFVGIVLAILFGVKSLIENKIRIRRTPFDLPVLLFIAAVFLSSVFSTSIFDSLLNFVPFLFAGIMYFAIIYNSRQERSLTVLIFCLLGGAILASLISIASFYKIYPFPYAYTKAQTFTTLGTLLDQATYLLLALPLGLYFLIPFLSKKHELEEIKNKHLPKIIGFALASIIILLGLIVSIYSLIKIQAPTILPIDIGFQTAFASISQDSGRLLQGLLFGGGFGEYMNVFTKFKQASFNASPLWGLTFFRSSTFVLELLATIGLAGLLAFLFLCYRIVKEKPLFIPLIIALAAAFVLPFSFYHVVFLFFLLGVYASLKGLSNHSKYFDVELQLVALKKGFLAFSQEATTQENSKILTWALLGIILIVSLFIGFFSVSYLISNIDFQKSIVSTSQNNGSLTYKYQTDAINAYKYSDAYQRVFSQTNLSLANSLASSIQQGTQPNTQTTQTIYTLVQQSINAARQATTLAPQNAVDWQNLSTIYRSLIGFGQNADSFAILAAQQAETLDPNNPQEYINLGGIYYQLSQWSKAQQQFQQAINLKADYANSYYNLGHTLMQEGDLKGALVQFQTVQQLVANDPANLAKINGEISALQAQINQPAAPAQTPKTTSLNGTAPSALPTQNPPVKIPPPANVTVTPTSASATGIPSPSPTP